jgi:hypothetical protein
MTHVQNGANFSALHTSEHLCYTRFMPKPNTVDEAIVEFEMQLGRRPLSDNTSKQRFNWPAAQHQIG